MRVLKNLLGDGSKIHAGEIQVSDLLNLMNSVIVEEGSNDDGNYIRFGNGWQICQKEIDLNQSVNQTIDALYRTATPMTVPFPKKFIESPFVDGALHDGIIAWPVVYPGRLSNAWDAIRAYSPVNNQTATKMTLFASGRWK